MSLTIKYADKMQVKLSPDNVQKLEVDNKTKTLQISFKEGGEAIMPFCTSLNFLYKELASKMLLDYENKINDPSEWFIAVYD